MAVEAAQRSDKKRAILDAALDLLRETGDAGLTMRKIAERSGMRLSNVQYYFKSRDDVLLAMVQRYFAQCDQDITELTGRNPAPTLEARARLLIGAGLSHGDELSDMCRIFRELWAISSRNDMIQDHMMEYYRTFSARITGFILGEGADPKTEDRVQSLLLPFFEGYSVTSKASALSTDETAEMLTDILVSIVKQGSNARE